MISRTGIWRLFSCGFVLSAAISNAVYAERALAGAANSISESLEFGGTIELVYERLQNFDLDSSEADGLDALPIELELEARFEPNEYFEAYFLTDLTHEFVLHKEGEQDVQNTELVITEAYVIGSDPNSGLSLQLGRQLFEDERQWLYDAELDAIRAAYRTSNLAIELSASRGGLVNRDLLNADTEEAANNYILYGAYELNEEVMVGAYGIVSEGGGDNDAPPVFLGLTSKGAAGDRITYWLDAALVRGHEDGRSLRGYGIDVLGTYDFDAPLSPRLIAGYAFGSGDSDPDDDRDGAFRQTGLQGDEADVGGVAPFRYCGEAVDPELSNMSIFTAGLGVRPTEGLSIDLVYHYYFQDEPLDELRDSAFDAEPTGESRRLGSEIDLVLGFAEVENLEVRGFLGYFLPGRAFAADADDALLARVEFEYEF
jgi:alginate production protein